MMDYPEYKRDLQCIHESEVYGLAVFDTAARFMLNVKRKKKWLALKALEEQTLERYLTYMNDSGQPMSEPKGWKFKGRFDGAVLGILPWRLSMKLLRNATQPYQEKFLRLKNSMAEDTHQEFFAYVYAHEKAIEAFARKEISGEQNSLAAVESLLGVLVQRL